ncbi:uncharacterized protein LOC107039401 [Diachasma alloeum]|uniref:uncharacterized protein LOC107039401 n=1 Tax=Diachasma alloeum TaxID=454923 RepID=UPI00073831CA|nr:uncharacterized protein LOC107039401 [Diachasma alloeum]
MNSVNLVVIVMALMCLVMASGVDNQDAERKLNRLGIPKLPAKIKVTTTRPVTRVRKPGTKPTRKNNVVALDKTNKLPVDSEEEEEGWTFSQLLKQAELRGRPKKHKKMKRALIALLLAYKLKFAALIPAIIGGLIMLVMTTGLAGFFFALFAAVLGLKNT